MNSSKYYKIESTINHCQRIVLVSHPRPDGDSCGVVLAMAHYLEGLGKDVAIFMADLPPASYEYLPGFEKIKTSHDIFQKKWDLIMLLDAGDLSYAGLDVSETKDLPLINIDHHVSNKGNGDINVTIGGASSTCEVVYDYFKQIGFEIDKKIATCLMSGILYDTDTFLNTATNSNSIKIASELVKKGVKIQEITDLTTRNRSLGGLKLWGLVLSRFQVNTKLGLAYTYITDKDLLNFKASEEEVSGLANFFNIISETSMSMLVVIHSDHTKFSLRTTRDSVDVSKLAQYFGGDGHKKAAGFTVPWRVEEVNGKLRSI
jgi:bifunctional oligoribonuclease and PAP phosphatase NrnA